MKQKLSMEARRQLADDVKHFAALGRSRREIAEELGVSLVRVATLCSAAGIETARKHRRRGFRVTTAYRVIKVIFDGSSQTDSEIGRSVGCTREFVGQVRAWMNENAIRKTGGAS